MPRSSPSTRAHFPYPPIFSALFYRPPLFLKRPLQPPNHQEKISARTYASCMVPEAVKNNPVLTSSTVALVIAVAASFGLELTAEQVTGILALYAAVVVPVVRSRVISTNRIAPKNDLPTNCPLCKQPLQ